MEKIIKSSTSSVIITPHSFILSKKFESVRIKLLNYHNGKIFSFDNVPTGLFKQRINGINKQVNSVRAAITITIPSYKELSNGYYTSGMIRFKAEDRQYILQKDNLDQFLGNNKQNGILYRKCFPEYENLLYTLEYNQTEQLKDLLINTNINNLSITIPNSCRYYTSSINNLNRTGKYQLYFNTIEERDYVYLLMNSSLPYLYWRVYDGGITFPKWLLMNIPINIDNKIIIEKILPKDDHIIFTIDNNDNIVLINRNNFDKVNFKNSEIRIIGKNYTNKPFVKNYKKKIINQNINYYNNNFIIKRKELIPVRGRGKQTITRYKFASNPMFLLKQIILLLKIIILLFKIKILNNLLLVSRFMLIFHNINYIY